jgi:hypothetical protein
MQYMESTIPSGSVSQAHSSLSHVQGNDRSKQSKASYSKGRWSSHSTENESDNNNDNNIPQSLTKIPKTTRPKHSENEIGKYCQLLCEKDKTLAQCNARLQSQVTSTVLHHQQESESFLKRKSQDISLLTTELATQKKKLQQTESAVCGILGSGEQTRIESCIIKDSRFHGSVTE